MSRLPPRPTAARTPRKGPRGLWPASRAQPGGGGRGRRQFPRARPSPGRRRHPAGARLCGEPVPRAGGRPWGHPLLWRPPCPGGRRCLLPAGQGVARELRGSTHPRSGEGAAALSPGRGRDPAGASPGLPGGDPRPVRSRPWSPVHFPRARGVRPCRLRFGRRAASHPPPGPRCVQASAPADEAQSPPEGCRRSAPRSSWVPQTTRFSSR